MLTRKYGTFLDSFLERYGRKISSFYPTVSICNIEVLYSLQPKTFWRQSAMLKVCLVLCGQSFLMIASHWISCCKMRLHGLGRCTLVSPLLRKKTLKLFRHLALSHKNMDATDAVSSLLFQRQF